MIWKKVRNCWLRFYNSRMLLSDSSNDTQSHDLFENDHFSVPRSRRCERFGYSKGFRYEMRVRPVFRLVLVNYKINVPIGHFLCILFSI